MKRGYIILLFLFSSIGLIMAATCGDGICDVGYTLDSPGKVEDSSTCFQDCGSKTHYTICEIDSVAGGTCEIDGEVYEISNVEWSGCGLMPSTMDFTISSKGNSLDFEGIIPGSGNWVPTMDYLQISVMTWPCATYTTTKQIILKTSGSELKDFLNINKDIFNLKKDNEATFDYSFPEWISKPYCKEKVINTDTSEEMTIREAMGCNPNNFILEAFEPGKYSVISEVYDAAADNTLGEDTIDFVVHECQLDEECSDESFFTKDICLDGEIRICSSSINVVLLISILIGVIFVILIIYFIFRRNK